MRDDNKMVTFRKVYTIVGQMQFKKKIKEHLPVIKYLLDPYIISIST